MSKYSENIPSSIIGAIGWFYDDIPENSTVLDIGCSTGYYGAYIKQHKNSTVYGVEVSSDKEEASKLLDGVYSFDLDGVWPKEIYEREYDVIFLGDVIEHLKDPSTVLKKISKLLSKDGKIYISTPNVAHLSVRLELLGGNFEYEKMGILDNTHLKYFTFNSLTSLVKKSGYDIIRIDSSESDYPKEVTEAILDQYGLKPSKKFWNLVSDPTARAFQYKLVLELREQSKKPMTTPVPTQKPEQYKANFIGTLQKQADESTELVKYLRNENTTLKDTLSNILNSKAYKLSQKLQKAKGMIKK
jgi:SAM-dependent methyltransferase